jgi:hypothetical protein
MGKTTRKTYEEVKKDFEEANCTLISTTYINGKQKLKYICPSGHQKKSHMLIFIAEDDALNVIIKDEERKN